MEKSINSLQNELFQKSLKLRGMSLSCKSYKLSQEIQKTQNETYKKYMFIKQLKNAMRKEEM